MNISDKFEINNYKDYQEHKKEIFDIIEEVMSMSIKEMAEKNPTFLIPHYDSLIEAKNFPYGDEVISIVDKEDCKNE